MNESVLISYAADQIALLTINRPEALNAINKDVMQSLHTFFTENQENKKLKGVIITGSGEKAFAAGADIKEFLELSAEEASKMSAFGHETYNLIENFHVPVIAAVNGYALGGGCELAMACHLRISGENAQYGLPEVKLGLIPGYGGSMRLIRYVGRSAAMELLLTGKNIEIIQAQKLGLSTKVVAAGSEIDAAHELILQIAKNGPNAISTIIKMFAHAYNDAEGMKSEIDFFGKAMQSDEAKEGIDAFLNKRKAAFTR